MSSPRYVCPAERQEVSSPRYVLFSWSCPGTLRLVTLFPGEETTREEKTRLRGEGIEEDAGGLELGSSAPSTDETFTNPDMRSFRGLLVGTGMSLHPVYTPCTPRVHTPCTPSTYPGPLFGAPGTSSSGVKEALWAPRLLNPVKRDSLGSSRLLNPVKRGSLGSLRLLNPVKRGSLRLPGLLRTVKRLFPGLLGTVKRLLLGYTHPGTCWVCTGLYTHLGTSSRCTVLGTLC